MKKTMFLLFVLPSIALADVYKCLDNGKTVYTAVPCGADAVHINPSDVLTDIPGGGAGQRNIEAARRYQQKIDADYAARMAIRSLAPKALDCSQQQREVDSIRSSMRSGYSASSSTYWHDRKRIADDALAACKAQ